MLTPLEKIVFICVVSATALAFALPVLRRLRLVLAGRSTNRFNEPGEESLRP